MTFEYEAGVWEQGKGLVVWSRHATRRAAIDAARKHAKQLECENRRSGGPLSWSGGWRKVGASTTWINSRGEETT